MKKPLQIAFFNHKGGVSKTTSVFHIGWKLAENGFKVLMVDCDPQCNLTGVVLTYKGEDVYPYETVDPKIPLNVKDGVSAAFDGRPIPLTAAKTQEVPGCPNLHILPGHVGLAEYESNLSIAHDLSGTLKVMHNMPGALRWLFNLTAESIGADYILIDMSPSLGSLNQNIFTTSDAFIVPVAPDFFSGMALRSLSKVLPRWAAWSQKAGEQKILVEADYPWPNLTPKYVGSLIQNYSIRKRDGKPAEPTKAYRRWFEELSDTKEAILIPSLREAGLLLPDDAYRAADCELSEFMVKIPDFNSLIATAQEYSKPVYALRQSDLESSGVVLQTQEESIDNFNNIYQQGVDKIVALSGSI